MPWINVTDAGWTPIHTVALREQLLETRRHITFRKGEVYGKMTIRGFTCSGVATSTNLNFFRALVGLQAMGIEESSSVIPVATGDDVMVITHPLRSPDVIRALD
jgi:Asp/Glu/hydantoin racemase